jgi:hypothetical protein
MDLMTTLSHWASSLGLTAAIGLSLVVVVVGLAIGGLARFLGCSVLDAADGIATVLRAMHRKSRDERTKT